MKVTVAGASGVVGAALLTALVNDGTEHLGLSRRAPEVRGCTHATCDLTDAAGTHAVVATNAADTTHLVYAALYEQPGLIAGWRDREQMATNEAMLKNLLDALEAADAPLTHVTLLQGTKAYGAHLAPMKVPGRESEPRHPHENFYWLQEDLLRARAHKADYTFTIWRPQVIFGHALHAPMNMLTALGVFAAISREKGEPLRYPGGPAAVMEAIDADLLARAIRFAWGNPAFDGETFNITNGDVFTFENVWHVIAECFQMPVGEPTRTILSETIYDEEATWREIVNRYNLSPHTIRELVGDSFFYADALMNTRGNVTPPPSLVSTVKLRQAGFDECLDTEDMLRQGFDRLKASRLLP